MKIVQTTTGEITPSGISFSRDAKLVERYYEEMLNHMFRPISMRWTNPLIRFDDLKQIWERDTAPLSSITEISMHSAYQQIIGMGPVAIPFILTEMMNKPNHWFWALRSIAGEDPVLPKHRGRIEEMTKDWVEWGRDQRYIT